ncbi:MAG: efflux RND transporter periplasmic adaptor subunit [Armatimonadota bacterium]|jgi:HlyD family secretion protein
MKRSGWAKPQWIALIVAAVVVAGGVVLAVALRGRGEHSGPQTAEVARRTLSVGIEALGAVQPMVGAEVRVGAQVSGRVEELYANVGDVVERGQLIARLDDSELRARVERAQADVSAAEEKWSEARAAAGAAPEQTAAAVEEARSSLDAARARLRQVEADAGAEPERAESDVQQAQRTLEAARARLEQTRARAGAQQPTSDAQIAQAQAAVESAEAKLARVNRGARAEEIASAEAGVRQAESRLREAEQNLARSRELFAKDYVAAQEVDRRRTERDIAQGDLDSAGHRLELLRTQSLPEDVRQAEADLAQARSRLAEVRSREVEVELAERDVTAAEAEVARAEAGLRTARANTSRVPVSRQQVEAARAEVERAEATLRRARAQQVDVELKRRAADAALAQVEQARAALREAEAKLSYTQIYAPISGVVGSVTTQEGETVAAGLAAPTFITIVDLDRLEVHAFVDETDIGRVEEGQQAVFFVDAYPDREFIGEVTAIYPQAQMEQNVVEYDVVIEIDDTHGLLKPDMTANVTIMMEAREDVLTVPNAAIRREGGRRVLYVEENGQFSPRPVEIGLRDASQTEILSGVDEGETVLVGDLEPADGGR